MSTVDRLLAELLALPAVRALTARLQAHDPTTYRHSLRVARFALVFATGDGMAPDRLRQTAVAAMLHDLGKTTVSADLLGKDGPLEGSERELMRDHAAAAVRDLVALDEFPDAHRIAPLHHEQQGEHSYPRSGEDRRGDGRGAERRRPLEPWVARAGRLIALADRYDALISHRAYKDPWPDDEVRTVLTAEMPDVAHLLDYLAPPERPPR
ncbi:MAG: HD domain-containing protein [Planctomycetota bacterium]|nr:HD domain-containing protein [Planctomycetota bacterium]